MVALDDSREQNKNYFAGNVVIQKNWGPIPFDIVCC